MENLYIYICYISFVFQVSYLVTRIHLAEDAILRAAGCFRTSTMVKRKPPPQHVNQVFGEYILGRLSCDVFFGSGNVYIRSAKEQQNLFYIMFPSISFTSSAEADWSYRKNIHRCCYDPRDTKPEVETAQQFSPERMAHSVRKPHRSLSEASSLPTPNLRND